MDTVEHESSGEWRWCQFSLGGCLLGFMVCAVLLATATQFVRAWQTFHVVTMSTRLTSSGTAVWGNRVIPIASLRSELEREADLLRKNGFKPRFLIERYSDTPKADIEELQTIAHEAGFDVVDTKLLSWPSPDWSKTED